MIVEEIVLPRDESVAGGKWKERKWCLIPACKKWARVRGLCPECYKVARRLIGEGKASWEELVKAGCALEAGKCGRRASEARVWMLGKLETGRRKKAA